MPQKDTLDNLRTPLCFRILSSYFTSVSIFSLSCYSIVSISVVHALSVNDDLFHRRETVPFFRLFTRQGDMECTGCGNTEHRGLKARVLL
jgi:hypothetical protein